MQYGNGFVSIRNEAGKELGWGCHGSADEILYEMPGILLTITRCVFEVSGHLHVVSYSSEVVLSRVGLSWSTPEPRLNFTLSPGREFRGL